MGHSKEVHILAQELKATKEREAQSPAGGIA